MEKNSAGQGSHGRGLGDPVNEFEIRLNLSKVALGEVPPDTVITNAHLFNSITREFIKRQSIWIKGDRVAYVGPDHHFAKNQKTQVIDANGMVILPGLIEEIGRASCRERV